MKRIVMLRSGWGSPNGLDVRRYEEAISYEVPVSLAEAFERAGYARVTGDVAPEAPPVAAPAIAEPVSVETAATGALSSAKPARAARRPRNLSGAQDRSLSAKE